MGKLKKCFMGILSSFLLLSVIVCGFASCDHAANDGGNELPSVGGGAGDSGEQEDDGVVGEEKTETYTLTFKLHADDTGVQITVEQGETLSADDSRIPALPVCEEIGYHYTWDQDVSTLTQSSVVTARKTAKTYTVYLDAKGGAVDVSSITVTFGETPNLPTPTETKEAKGFMGWYYGGEKLNASKAWAIDQDGITLNAVWSEGSSWTGDYN